MTTFGHLLEAVFILALIAAIFAAAIDLARGGDTDQADDDTDWTETDRAYRQWIHGEGGL